MCKSVVDVCVCVSIVVAKWGWFAGHVFGFAEQESVCVCVCRLGSAGQVWKCAGGERCVDLET